MAAAKTFDPPTGHFKDMEKVSPGGDYPIERRMQATVVIVMRAKAPLTTVTTHQVEKDRWFKTVDAANTAAKEAAKALKAAVDSGALTS